jgi:oligosaccharide repeat unit polymerase
MLNAMIYIVSTIVIIPFFENLIHFVDIYILHPNPNSLYEMYINKGVDGIDNNDLTTWLSPIGKICNSIILKIQSLMLLSLFYYLTRKKINKFCVGGILLIIINVILFNVLLSGRGVVVFFLLFSLFFFFLFRKLILKKMLKKIAVAFLIVGGCFAITIGILTIARFSGHGFDYSMLDWISMYLGGGLVNFDYSMWNILQHTEGDRSFSLFKYLVGFDTYLEHIAFREHWYYEKTNVMPHTFFTYVGDWYSDLGGASTLLLITILSLLVRKITSNPNSISFISLYIYVSFSYIMIVGFTIYPFLTSKSTLGIMICFCVCLLLNIKKTPTI